MIYQPCLDLSKEAIIIYSDYLFDNFKFEQPELWDEFMELEHQFGLLSYQSWSL